MDGKDTEKDDIIEISYQMSTALSALGNSACAVILPLIVLQTTGSVLNAGLLALATGIPQFVAASIGGTLVDRFAYGMIALIGDVLSAVAVAFLAFFISVSSSGVSMWVFILFGILSSIGDVPALTAREAMVPVIAAVSKGSISRLVSTREALSSAMILVGPALAAVLLSTFPAHVGLYCVAACSLIAVVTSLRLVRLKSEDSVDEAQKMTAIAEFSSGVVYLFGEMRLRLITALGLVVVVFLANVQGIVLPQYFNALGCPSVTGWTLSALALGTMVGAGIYAAIVKRSGQMAILAIGSLICSIGACLLAVLAAFGQSVQVVFPIALLGIGIGICSSAAGVYTLKLSSVKYRGRVLGIRNALAMGVAPITSLAIAVCITYFGSSLVLWVLAGLLTALLFALILRLASYRGSSDSADAF